MKIVIAIDSFKGSLTSPEANSAAAEGVRRIFPDAEIITRPLADGGEGTTAVLCEGMGEQCEPPLSVTLSENPSPPSMRSSTRQKPQS